MARETHSTSLVTHIHRFGRRHGGCEMLGGNGTEGEPKPLVGWKMCATTEQKLRAVHRANSREAQLEANAIETLRSTGHLYLWPQSQAVKQRHMVYMWSSMCVWGKKKGNAIYCKYCDICHFITFISLLSCSHAPEGYPGESHYPGSWNRNIYADYM